jgi:hypothetical protein
MSIKTKLDTAREHIQAERYAEARELLATIDHPKAREWIEKLDAKIEAPAPSTGRRVWRYVVPLLLITVLVAAGVLLLTNNDPDSRSVPPGVVPTPTPGPTDPSVALLNTLPDAARTALDTYLRTTRTQDGGLPAYRVEYAVPADNEAALAALPEGNREAFGELIANAEIWCVRIAPTDSTVPTHYNIERFPGVAEDWSVRHLTKDSAQIDPGIRAGWRAACGRW